eukprot:11029599-Heterocapsa_arctica.AAC.1
MPGTGAGRMSCVRSSQVGTKAHRKQGTRVGQVRRPTRKGNRTSSSRTWQGGGLRPTRTSGMG